MCEYKRVSSGVEWEEGKEGRWGGPHHCCTTYATVWNAARQLIKLWSNWCNPYSVNVYRLFGLRERGVSFCPNDKLYDVWQHSLFAFAEYIENLWHLGSRAECSKIIIIKLIFMKVFMYFYVLICLFSSFQGWPSCTQGVHHVETKPCSRSVGSFHATYLCRRYRSVHGISQFHVSPPSSESHWG